MAGNRKARRADAQQAANTASTASTTSTTPTAFQPSTEMDDAGVEYILQHPDRSGPQGKTLFDMADERQRELDAAHPDRPPRAPPVGPPAGAVPFNDEEPIGPAGDAVLYGFSMAVLHLTLDVIVYSQYREDVVWAELFRRAASALPVFCLLVYLTHVPFANRFPVLRDIAFLVGSIAAGCYMVYSGNKNGYFYVMKAAPPVGTLWIWSVVEMSLPYAGASALAVFAYLKWNNFDFF